MANNDTLEDIVEEARTASRQWCSYQVRFSIYIGTKLHAVRVSA